MDGTRASAGRMLAIGTLVVGVLVLESAVGSRTPLSGLAADAAGATSQNATAVFIGLTAKVRSNSPQLEKQLDEALAAGPRSFADIREVYEEVLSKHVQLAQDLRTAFAFRYTFGFDPSQPVAGVPPDQVAGIEPTAWYFLASNAHMHLSQRLETILEEYRSSMDSGEEENIRERLAKARNVVTLPAKKTTEEQQ